MPSVCACGCGLQVAESGHRRRDCRLRELAAGRLCPRNVTSTVKAHHNLKNNPKHNRIKKRDLRDANLQIVQDDPSILGTKKMSAGISASVSVPTDDDWSTLQP